jgi:hypothetical protein
MTDWDGLEQAANVFTPFADAIPGAGMALGIAQGLRRLPRRP